MWGKDTWETESILQDRYGDPDLRVACIGQAGPPFVVYALARRWEKEPFRVNSMAYFAPLNAMALLSYWQLHLLSTRTYSLALAALLPALVASVLGLWIKARVNEATFRKLAIGLILLVGLAGLMQALMG